MQIHFSRDGTQAVAKVTLTIPTYDARVFPMVFECGSEVYAGLLVEAMNAALQNEVETIRRDEYEAGWNDKTSRKRPKRGWFATSFVWRNRK